MNGKGSVKLIIANSNKRQASAELIKDVKDHIGAVDGTGEAPIGADVTVISYTEKTVNIDMDVLIDENTTLENSEIFAPENAVKLVVNFNSSGGTLYKNRLIKNNKPTIFFVVEDKNVYDKSILEEIREKQKK